MASIITQSNPHFTFGKYATIELKGMGIYNIVLDRYVMGQSLSVQLELASDPLEYIKLSTNVLDTRFGQLLTIGPREFALRNYSENIKIIPLLEGCPYFKDTGRTVRLPFNIVPVWSLV